MRNLIPTGVGGELTAFFQLKAGELEKVTYVTSAIFALNAGIIGASAKL